MSLERAKHAIQGAQLRDNDRKWFVAWLTKYAAWASVVAGAELPVERERLIGFLQFIKAQGKPAWQRWQAARGVEFYISHVLRRDAACMADIVNRLAGAAELERAQQPASEESVVSEFALPIDSTEPKVVQALRREVRTRHYSRRTEKAYAGWVGRFLKYGAWSGDSTLE